MARSSTKGTTSLTLVSLTFTSGESYTAREVYQGPYSACIAAILPKGYWGSGDLAGFIVERSVAAHQGDEEDARLTNDWAWAASSGVPPQGADLPEDVRGVRAEPLDIALEKLEAYSTITEEGLAKIRSFIGNPVEYLADYSNWRDANPSLSALATELSDKLLRGNTHKRFWIPIFYWNSYHWVLPILDPGGTVTTDPDGSAQFPPDMEWLRAPDQWEQNGLHYIVKREWYGLPTTGVDGGPGGWDPDLYPSV